MVRRTAAEAHESDVKYHWIAHRVVEPGRALFHLADNHVRPIRRTLKDWIGYTVAQCSPSPSPDHIVASTCKSEGENVEIGDGPGMVATIGLQHRVFRNREIPVHVKVRLHESDGRIHAVRQNPTRKMPREIAW